MLIEWVTSLGVFTLAEGSDRSVGKRCGPEGFAAPLTVLGEDTPCIDAEWQRPQERGNRTNRISFSVSIELATVAQALAMVSQVKRIPAAGVLVTIDEDSGELVRYDNATLRSIDPRQRGVSVDVVYSFVAGEDVSMGTTPAIPTGLTATPGTLQVDLAWSPAAGAHSYRIWIFKDGWSFGAEVEALEWTHESGDTVQRLYFVGSVGRHGDLSELSAGVLRAGLSA